MDVLGQETIAMKRKTGNSMVGEPGGVVSDQWKLLMRKFCDASQKKCRSLPTEMVKVPRPMMKFPTMSTYEGTWNHIGMSGDGTYVFPDGVTRYEGEFEDGMFHGTGSILYKDGKALKGKWVHGKAVERKVIFDDGLEYTPGQSSYCKYPDRRYTIEYNKDLRPGGDTYVTNKQPPPEIPPEHFDVGDGFFDANKGTVFKHDDPTHLLRTPAFIEKQWIIQNCRVNPLETIGPAQFLYEQFLQPTLEKEFPPPPGGCPTKLEEKKEETLGQSQTAAPLEHWSMKYDDNETKMFWDPRQFGRFASTATGKGIKFQSMGSIRGMSMMGKKSVTGAGAGGAADLEAAEFTLVATPYVPGMKCPDGPPETRKMLE